MLTYKAMFRFVNDEVHAEVLDFPGAITCASTLEEARRLLSSALADMAELALTNGEALPLPNPSVTDRDADLEEPIHLLIGAASVVKPVPVHHETA
jgi:predicted RNase H-like HicB family nuclease